MAGNSETIRAYHEAGHMVAEARSPQFFKLSGVDILDEDDQVGYARTARLQMLPGEIELRGFQLPRVEKRIITTFMECTEVRETLHFNF